MLKKVVILSILPLILNAYTVSDLFSALKRHSQTKVDEILIQKAKIGSSLALSQLYPTIGVFTSLDSYNSPTNLRPVAPSESAKMLKNRTIPQPFSYNIARVGVTINMPLFVKSIYTMADKAKAMQKSAEAKREIDIIKNEALIVGSLANLEYLKELKKSLNQKEKSLLETEKTLQIKVNSGRSPASALYKIDDGLNQINIAKNSIELQKTKIFSLIESLTGIKLEKEITIEKRGEIEESDFGILKPLKEKLKASKLEIKAQREKLSPALFAHGSYNYSIANSYNNHKKVDEKYGNVGVVLKIPIINKAQEESIEKAKIELMSDKMELAKLRDELKAKVSMLKKSLTLLDNSIKLLKKSIQNRKELLDIAKVNYKIGRLSTEEYLRYEDEVVSAKAKLYQAEANKWQVLMQLATIYANDIEKIVK